MSFAVLLVSLFVVFQLPVFRRRAAFRTQRHRAAMAAGVFFVAAGALHFLAPETYERMIPPFVPFPRLATYVSGLAEMVGGIGMLVPRWRRPASLGLAALLFAILPANVHVALSSVNLPELPFPRWYFWARLPFQLFYVGWVLWAGRASAPVDNPPVPRVIFRRMCCLAGRSGCRNAAEGSVQREMFARSLSASHGDPEPASSAEREGEGHPLHASRSARSGRRC